MATVSRASSLIVAASVGVVEALKDQVGLCRWNYPLRSLYTHAKSNMGSLSHSRRVITEAKDAANNIDDKARRSEESLRTVMYLSCWGPN